MIKENIERQRENVDFVVLHLGNKQIFEMHFWFLFQVRLRKNLKSPARVLCSRDRTPKGPNQIRGEGEGWWPWIMFERKHQKKREQKGWRDWIAIMLYEQLSENRLESIISNFGRPDRQTHTVLLFKNRHTHNHLIYFYVLWSLFWTILPTQLANKQGQANISVLIS